MTATFLYRTNCIHAKGEDIRDMVDNAREITWETFIKHVPVSLIRTMFNDYSYRGETHNKHGELTTGFHIKNDWAVGFFKSKYKGVPCYYLDHSRIEYIFTEI